MGFSALLEKDAISAHSAPFNFCGYEWFLGVTPMHKQSGDGIPYVALGLCLSQIGFNTDYIINAVFELSMYNHSNGTYCGRKASYSFSVNKMHSEKICLIPLQELLKSSDFLVGDTCVFGVRILKAAVSSPERNLL
uniref:MATH domain-containing protein n=1 Tax=Arundo donax TaxID=35708 RepID=A0A0A9CLF8_ARUDO